MKVFLDTNVLVAAFATRGLCSDVLRLVLVDHDLVVSRVVVDELRRVLAEKIGVAVKRVSRACELLEVYVAAESDDRDATPLALRDPQDLPMVRSALAAGADVLVSGDRDLLAARLPIEVLTPRAFWERLRLAAAAAPVDEVHEGPAVGG